MVDVKPLNGSPDGSHGYEVRTVRSTTLFAKHPQRFTCRGVVFAASSLGTMDLLFDLKDRGRCLASAINSANMFVPTPNRCSRYALPGSMKTCRRVSPSDPVFTSTNTRTSKRSVTRGDPTP